MSVENIISQIFSTYEMSEKGCSEKNVNQTCIIKQLLIIFADNILKCNFDKRNMYVTMGL